MAKPNYSFEKRKKELERQKKKEDKKNRKHERVTEGEEGRVTIEETADSEPVL